MSYEEDQKKARQLALLCMEPHQLSDRQLDEIITHGDEIFRYLDGVSSFARSGAAREKRYRARKLELAKLPDEELQRMSRLMSEERGRVLQDDEHDELPDSFFEAPPKDSDEHIIHELLEERRKAEVPTKK